MKGPEDLRPISLLPLPGKIVEHLLYTQIDSFLERHDLLTDKQNGFRKKRSTIKTIFSFTSDLTQIYNCDKDTIALYIDFKKAFDTVNHTKLINKFKSFNFDENLIKLHSSYLNQRKQSTKYEWGMLRVVDYHLRSATGKCLRTETVPTVYK